MPIGPSLPLVDGLLSNSEVHVWQASLNQPEEQIRRLFAELASDEQARSGRFLVSGARDQYIVSHAFLRTVLARYLQVQPRAIHFYMGKNGKPELVAGHNLRFNLSHTDGMAVIGISSMGRIGVDVEKIRENLNPLELAGRFFSSQEYDWLKSRPSSQRLAAFFACWTAKESYIKACGGGLSMGLAGFAIIPAMRNAQLRLEIYNDPDESKKWSIWQLELDPGYCAAVAIEAREITIRLGEWSPST